MPSPLSFPKGEPLEAATPRRVLTARAPEAGA